MNACVGGGCSLQFDQGAGGIYRDLVHGTKCSPDR